MKNLPPHRPPADNNEPWVMQAPVVCTSHFPQADADLLYEQATFLERDKDTDESRTAIVLIEDWAVHLPVEQLSESTRKLLQTVEDLGYAYLRLGPDGDEWDGFPTFEW